MKNDTVKCMAVLLSAAILFCAACSGREPENSKEAGTTIAESSRETDTTASENISETAEGQSPEMTTETGEQETVAEKTLKMKIGEHPVEVVWENNEAAEALKEFAKDGPVTIQMSMYGGFEQVGSIGKTLPSKDVQTYTSPGDLVLYQSSRLVVFYGTNSWAYTRLGRITGQTEEQLEALLGNGDVVITLSME